MRLCLYLGESHGSVGEAVGNNIGVYRDCYQGV